MQGRLLARALCRLTGDELRTIYVLGCDTAVHDLLLAKGADWFTRSAETDRFTLNLQKKVEACRARGDEELRLELLLEMAKVCKLQGTYLTSERELADYLEAIAGRAEAFLHADDKAYRAYREARPETAPFDALIRYQLDRVLNELGRKVGEGSPEEQEAYMRRLRAFMDGMPEEQQNALKQKLGVDELTDQVLRNTIAAGGTGLLLSIMVELSGFAFYTTATSLVASFAGLFGLTLPFGAYTMLTSFIAVLSNPLVLVGLMVGGGHLLLKWQDGKLQRRLLPLLLLQIALPELERSDSVDCAPLLACWKDRYDEHARIRREIEERTARIARWDEESAELARRRSACRAREDEAKRQTARIESELSRRIVDAMPRLPQALPELSGPAAQYEANRANIRAQRSGRGRKEPGVLGLVKQAWNHTASGVKVMDLERKQRALEESMTRAALRSSGEWCLKERLAAKEQAEIIEACRVESERIFRQSSAVYELRRESSRMNAESEQELKRLEKQVYGLGHL